MLLYHKIVLQNVATAVQSGRLISDVMVIAGEVIMCDCRALMMLREVDCLR